MAAGPCSTALKKGSTEAYYAAENTEKEKIMFQLIYQYFEARPALIEEIKPICEDLPTLRKLNGMVTKLTTHGNICYFFQGCGGTYIAFNMIASYEQQLKHYQKRYFDAAAHRTKVCIHGFNTTYCQLNFFRWVNEYRLLSILLSMRTTLPPPNKTKTKEIKDRITVFVAPFVVPAIPAPTERKFTTLALTKEKEYSLLMGAIDYYRMHPLPNWTDPNKSRYKILGLK